MADESAPIFNSETQPESQLQFSEMRHEVNHDDWLFMDLELVTPLSCTIGGSWEAQNDQTRVEPYEASFRARTINSGLMEAQNDQTRVEPYEASFRARTINSGLMEAQNDQTRVEPYEASFRERTINSGLMEAQNDRTQVEPSEASFRAETINSGLVEAQKDQTPVEPSEASFRAKTISNGPMEAPNYQTQAETSEASYPPISGSGKSEITPARAKKRNADKMCRSKIEGNLDIAYGLASSCSEASERRPTKARKLAEIAVHMKSLELKNEAHQQENETLKRKYEAVQLENEALQLENETLKQNSMIEKFPSTSNAIETDILKKIEADDVSRVTLKDFNLDGPLKTVGKYSVPLSLCETAKQINEVCGDISATSKFNMDSNQGIYQMFCAIIKEMKDLQFEEITEDQILKWRDVINDALRMNFNVGFAMEHLKKIAKAYDGAMRLIKLDNVNSRIFNLKAQLSAAKVEQYEISKISQVYMDAAQQFVGKRVSSGMFESAIVTARGNS